LDKLSTTYDADYKKMVEEYQGNKKIRSWSCYSNWAINGTPKEPRQTVKIVAFRDNAQKELQRKRIWYR
jgi:outer membrane protein